MKKTIVIILLGILIVGAIVGFVRNNNESKQILFEATLYQSPFCGCCGKYTEYLEENGVNVTVVKSDEVFNIKNNLGIPEELWSCHTILINGKIIEGHVPFDIILQFLQSPESQSYQGIAIPGMPQGLPGMPGKLESYTVYLFNETKIIEWVSYG